MISGRHLVFLARKITRAKWHTHFGPGAIPADAVTADLRTTNNTLSFWQCGDGTDEEIDDAALALAAGGQRIDNIDIVWLFDGDLRADGHSLYPTAGRTPVAEMVDRHVDLRFLDYVRLGKIAGLVMSAIEQGRHRRLRKQLVTELLLEAVQQRRIDLSDLQDNVQEYVKAAGR